MALVACPREAWGVPTKPQPWDDPQAPDAAPLELPQPEQGTLARFRRADGEGSCDSLSLPFGVGRALVGGMDSIVVERRRRSRRPRPRGQCALPEAIPALPAGPAGVADDRGGVRFKGDPSDLIVEAPNDDALDLALKSFREAHGARETGIAAAAAAREVRPRLAELSCAELAAVGRTGEALRALRSRSGNSALVAAGSAVGATAAPSLARNFQGMARQRHADAGRPLSVSAAPCAHDVDSASRSGPPRTPSGGASTPLPGARPPRLPPLQLAHAAAGAADAVSSTCSARYRPRSSCR